MAQNPKGDLISDLADTLLSGSGLNLSDIVDSVAENVGGKSADSFPVLSSANWWALRNRFKKNIPATITKKWVSDVLDITAATAEKNILPVLKQIGFISATGKTTDRAEAWTSDSKYEQICERIKKDVYPADLREMDSSTKTAQAKITSWFKKKTGAAETTAKRMTSFYLLLDESLPENAAEKSSGTSASKKTPSSAKSLSVNIRIDFPSNTAARQFDEILSDIASQVHAKVSNLS